MVPVRDDGKICDAYLSLLCIRAFRTNSFYRENIFVINFARK